MVYIAFGNAQQIECINTAEMSKPSTKNYHKCSMDVSNKLKPGGGVMRK